MLAMACSTASSSGPKTASPSRSSPKPSSRRTAPRSGSSIFARESSSRTVRNSPPTTPCTLTDYHLLMVPNGFKDWAKPVGTGPFTLEGFDPGVRIMLKKRPDYWKQGRGWLDGADVTVINDSSARLNALISGQVDAINRVDHRAVALLSKTPKIEVVRAPGGWFTILAMMIDRDPYTNPDIRLALKYAADREQILKALFSGYGTLGNDHPIPRTDPYFNTELLQR